MHNEKIKNSNDARTPKPPNQWRVRRTGALPVDGNFHPLGIGWIATDSSCGVGYWFPTWTKALDYADHEANRQEFTRRQINRYTTPRGTRP